MRPKVRLSDASQPVKRTSKKNASQSTKLPLKRRLTVHYDETESDETSQSPFRKLGRISIPPSIDQRPSRKSTEPNGCIKRRTINSQYITKLSTPRIVFERNAAHYSDDESDIDYIGRIPSPWEVSESSTETSGDESDDKKSSYRQPIKRPKNYRQNSEQLSKLNDSQREKCKLQNTANLIPRMAFKRLVRDIMMQQGTNVYSMPSTTIDCLLDASQQMLIQYFEDNNSRAKPTNELNDRFGH